MKPIFSLSRIYRLICAQYSNGLFRVITMVVPPAEDSSDEDDVERTRDELLAELDGWKEYPDPVEKSWRVDVLDDRFPCIVPDGTAWVLIVCSICEFHLWRSWHRADVEKVVAMQIHGRELSFVE